jgi:UDP-N-acetylmuramate: L-alanyl-gamma-D-glutamyl-meso-diaminopimelate ligase
MDEPDIAIVYFNPKALALKRIDIITPNQIITAFDRKDLLVFTDSEKLGKYLRKLNWKGMNLLMMSSGNFNGINMLNLIE